jgi:16S rRNA (cytidine1402-2'-O)-methyltransferase
MPTNQFFFAGFFESKAAKKLQTIPSSLIFYESARRLLKTLASMAVTFDDRQVAVVREISKIYEESIYGTYEEVIETFTKKSSIKGEIVVVLSPPSEKEASLNNINEQIASLIKTHSIKDIASIVNTAHGIPKKQAYDLALEIKNTRMND